MYLDYILCLLSRYARDTIKYIDDVSLCNTIEILNRLETKISDMICHNNYNLDDVILKYNKCIIDIGDIIDNVSFY